MITGPAGRSCRWSSAENGDFVGDDEGFFGLAFCQFGRGYAGREMTTFTSMPRRSSTVPLEHPEAGQDLLARVERDRLGEKAAYRFFAGLDAQGQPLWSNSIAARRRVAGAANGTHRIAASYNAPLRRYLLSAR